MKKIFYSFTALIMALITFTSCEDVPMPYDAPGTGGGNNQETTTIEPTGSGTADDPFNVAAAIEKCKEAGTTATSETYYVKGVVKSVDDSGVAQYGNINIDMIDEGGSSVFKAFQIYSFNGKKFTAETAANIKDGDVVVVKGNLVNYMNNTPETNGKGTAWLVSVNGEGSDNGGSQTTAEAKGTGTESDPFNVAAAIKKCQETGTTATSEQYYVKGKVQNVDVSGVAQYGNINIDMVDEGTTAVFKAFQIYSFNGKKFTAETAAQIKEGDEVIVKGNLVNYMNNTPETTGKGAAYLVSLNGKTEQGGGNEDKVIEPKGTGTEADPFNVAAAIKKCEETGETATEEQYYVEGVVVNVDASGATQYGNVTLDITDKGGSDVFKAFQIAGFNGEKFTAETAATIKSGDVVIVKGNLVNYKGNTPETTGKSAGQLIKLNGKAEYGTAPDNTGTDGNTIVFGSMGYQNAQDFDGETITVGDATLTWSKGTGSTTPKYYTTGSGMRLYGSNTLVISSSKEIAKIVFTYDNGKDSNGRPYYATSSNTSFTPGAYDYDAQTWNGSEKSVTMSYTANGGHVRIKSISISYK